MSTITTDDGTSRAHGEAPYSGLPNELVRAAQVAADVEAFLIQGTGL